MPCSHCNYYDLCFRTFLWRWWPFNCQTISAPHFTQAVFFGYNNKPWKHKHKHLLISSKIDIQWYTAHTIVYIYIYFLIYIDTCSNIKDHQSRWQLKYMYIYNWMYTNKYVCLCTLNKFTYLFLFEAYCVMSSPHGSIQKRHASSKTASGIGASSTASALSFFSGESSWSCKQRGPIYL